MKKQPCHDGYCPVQVTHNTPKASYNNRNIDADTDDSHWKFHDWHMLVLLVWKRSKWEVGWRLKIEEEAALASQADVVGRFRESADFI